ncbi:MAG: hypothetical protein ACI9FR_000048 [Cryomorphaceae bacterium]|jgi:hypothetical protein
MNDILNKNLHREQTGSVRKQTEFQQLDAMFNSLRSSEPVLADDNFTKVVLNSLPAATKRDILGNRGVRSVISFDLLGLFVGVICAYMFVEMRTVLEFVLSVVPESIVLSPLVAVATLSSLVLLSFGAWWSVEYGSKA